jgi:anti-anti-sigma factor
MSAQEARATSEAVTVTASRDGDCVVVSVDGELDLGAREGSDSVVLPLLDANTPATSVDVDLGAVTFMDSSGLGILVRLWHWCEPHDARLRLTAVSPNVLRILEYSGVTEMFEISAA